MLLTTVCIIHSSEGYADERGIDSRDDDLNYEIHERSSLTWRRAKSNGEMPFTNVRARARARRCAYVRRARTGILTRNVVRRDGIHFFSPIYALLNHSRIIIHLLMFAVVFFVEI